MREAISEGRGLLTIEADEGGNQHVLSMRLTIEADEGGNQ